MQPAGAVERALRAAQALRQIGDRGRSHRRAVGERLGRDHDRVDRGLAAHAAGRRDAEVALHELRRERPPQMHRDDVVGLLAELDVGAVLDLGELERRREQALRVEKPGGELEVVAGRAHRDRDAHRFLAGAGRADLERLLAREAVAALAPDAVLDGEHPRLDGRPPQRRSLGGGHGAYSSRRRPGPCTCW